jgi:hypothetical protein
MPSSSLLVAASIGSALIAGLVPVVLGSLKESLTKRFDVSDLHIDRLTKWLYFLWIPLMPLAGWLVDHWGVQTNLFWGSGALACALCWIGLRQTYASAFWGVLGLALAGASVTIAAIALMPRALTFGEEWSIGAALCLGFLFVSLASLATPILLPWLVARLGYRHCVVYLGLLCLVPAALAALAPADEFPVPPPARSLDDSLGDVRLWLIALALFLYFPLERTLEVWPQPYLAGIGYTPRSITRLLIGFWVAFLLMRFGLGWTMDRGYEVWVLFTLLLTSSMIIGNLAGSDAPGGGYIGFWLVGACYGPILPGFLGVLLDLEFSRGVPGLALGVILSLSALSTLIVQPWFVAYTRGHPARLAMRIPLVLGLITAAPTLVLAIIRHTP